MWSTYYTYIRKLAFLFSFTSFINSVAFVSFKAVFLFFYSHLFILLYSSLLINKISSNPFHLSIAIYCLFDSRAFLIVIIGIIYVSKSQLSSFTRLLKLKTIDNFFSSFNLV